MWYIYTVEFYSAIKNETMSFACKIGTVYVGALVGGGRVKEGD
jgi:hypothetical protein